MEQFTPVIYTEPETKNHYKKEVAEFIKAEADGLKNIWLSNFQSNFKRASSLKKADYWFNCSQFKDAECAVVGSGPSLDCDIKALLKYRNQVKIVCVDSAFLPLVKNGIKPDFVFSRNFDKDVLKLFKGIAKKDTKIVANLFQHPDLFAKCPGDFYTYLPYDEHTLLSATANLNPQIPKLLMKPSAFAMAFIFARCMKFRTYYLLGSDFCFNDYNNIYCSNVAYDKKSVSEGEVVYPESIFLEKTMSTRELFYSSEDLFRLIAVESNNQVFNCAQNSILYNLNWAFFEEIMKRLYTTKKNFFEFAKVFQHTGDEQVDRSNDITLNYFNAISARSMFLNRERVLREKNVKDLIDKKEMNKDKYCVICAAGPSLDEHIETLKKYRDNFTVFGVDASLLPLYKRGVEPDYILSIDPCNLSRFFKDFDGSKTALVASLNTHNEAVNAWKNDIYFYYPTPIKRFNYWLLGLIEGYENVPFLVPFNNCGSTTVLLAIEMGFKEIALMGMDFSFTGDKMYASGAITEEILGIEKIDNASKIEKNLSRYKLKKIVNCKGEMVYTDGMFGMYAEKLEKFVEMRSVSNIFNTSSSILKIPYIPFDGYLKRINMLQD